MQPAQRFSKKRQAILDVLASTTSHPSAEWVYLQLKPLYPDLSLGTVYRNLAQFKEQGQIMSLGTVKGIERFDANTSPHVHFICAGCDAVIDLDEMQVPDSLRRTAAACCGGQVDGCQLSFTGYCRECINNERIETA